MSRAYFRTLFDYNRWANKKVLDAAEQVPEEDYFAQAQGLSFGSLHATLVHQLIADIIWVARWQHRLPPPKLANPSKTVQVAETDVPTFAEVKRLFAGEEAKQKTFFSFMTESDLATAINYKTSAGVAMSEPLEELMAHFFNHGTQFRSEAAVRLTQAGQSPGDLDLIVFLRQR